MQFTGRARRSEFWYFALFNFIITLILGAVDAALGMTILESIYGLAMLLPGIAVAMRRLHDIGKSGWFLLIGLIPLVGFLYLIYLFVQEGEAGDNQYGSNPKGLDSGDNSLELDENL